MEPNDVIDQKYQIVRQLGAGGMGAVYEARHLGTGRRVAVKVILNGALQTADEALERFQREARAAGAIESLHIAQVLDSGVDTRTRHPYMVMEHLAGEDLQRTIQRLGPLPPDLVLRIVSQACLGLQKAHEAGVVHRDIKPANIFLARHDAGAVLVKLLDFGIAKATADQFSAAESPSLTRTGALLGSPYYMSPEQAIGAKTIDHRTDIWSLGIVLYEALGGRTPFADRDTIGGLILAIYSEATPPIQLAAPWVSHEVAAIVHHALARDPDARFQTIGEMLSAISRLLPHGYTVSESMLVPALRESAVPPIQTLVVPQPPAMGMSVRTHAFAVAPVPNTGGGVETPLVAVRRAPRAGAVVSIAVGAALALGIGAVGLQHVLGRGGQAIQPVATIAAVPPAPAASADPAGAGGPAVPTASLAPPDTVATAPGSADAADASPAGAHGGPDAGAPRVVKGLPAGPAPVPPRPVARPRPDKPTPTNHEQDVF